MTELLKVTLFLLFVQLGIWLLLDWVVWKIGGVTFSQWIIKKIEKSKGVAWSVVAILVIMAIGVVTLFFHFELDHNL